MGESGVRHVLVVQATRLGVPSRPSVSEPSGKGSSM